MQLPRLLLTLAYLSVALDSPAQTQRPQSDTPTLAELRARPVSIRAKGRWQEGMVLRSVGVRGMLTASEIPRREDGSGVGVAVAERGMGYLTLDWLSARYHDQLALGFGSLGLEGEASVDAAVGVRPMFGKRHGPLLRVGLKASIFGNDDLYSSLLELPQVQLGYQAFGSQRGFELAGRVGYVLTGRYSVPGSRNVLSHVPDFGGHALVAVQPFFITTDLSYLPIDRTVTAQVLSLRSALCGIVTPVLTCFDLLFQREVGQTAGPHAVSRYVGVSLLLGRTEYR